MVQASPVAPGGHCLTMIAEDLAFPLKRHGSESVCMNLLVSQIT